MEPERPPRPRWVRGVVVAVVAFELAAAAALVARDRGPDAPHAPAAASATPTGRPPRQDSADRSAALRTTAVDALLARRARAVRDRDRAAFAATMDPAQDAFVARQLGVFDALRDVPLAAWEYDLAAHDAVPAVTTYGADAWAPRVTLRYRLRGHAQAATSVDQFFTFVRRGDRWLIAGDRDYETRGRRTGRDLWDFGRVAVVRGARSLVLGHPGNHAFLRDVARHADDAVPRVSAVWGTGWAQAVVVVVPATQDEVGAIIGDDGDLSRIAAVAVADLPSGGRPAGNRVVVNPANFRRLGGTGRRVVLAHEVTHVATRDASSVGVPNWLVEGFADYVGYLRSGLSAHAICQELAADVRAGKAPAALPADGDFDGGNARLAQAYESAWLAVRLIAERVGERGLVRVYRRAGQEPVSTVLRAELGLSLAEFTQAWRGYVRRTLG